MSGDPYQWEKKAPGLLQENDEFHAHKGAIEEDWEIWLS